MTEPEAAEEKIAWASADSSCPDRRLSPVHLRCLYLFRFPIRHRRRFQAQCPQFLPCLSLYQARLKSPLEAVLMPPEPESAPASAESEQASEEQLLLEARPEQLHQGREFSVRYTAPAHRLTLRLLRQRGLDHRRQRLVFP